jgi:hypothetical protein
MTVETGSVEAMAGEEKTTADKIASRRVTNIHFHTQAILSGRLPASQ